MRFAAADASRGAVVVAALLVTSAAAVMVHDRTVRVVNQLHLLPMWDPAAHLLDGWTGWWSLRTLQPLTFFWNFWEEGLWPPAYAFWQIPFYFALGPELGSGLVASLAAFVLLGVAGALLLVLDSPQRDAKLVPVAVWLTLLVTSPYYLAYSSAGMMEMFGAFAQALVYIAWWVERRRRDAASGRLFALSLTALFFTKYNYLMLCAVPLLLHEYLERTAGASLAERAARAWVLLRRAARSPEIVLVALYLVALAVLIRSGGFEFCVAGHLVEVRRIGSTGHVVMLALAARIVFLHRRGRIDWKGVLARDRRIRPLLVWFVLPVVVWLISPYPNHLRDFVDLLVNQPHGVEGFAPSLGFYAGAFRQYFRGDAELVAALVLFAVAATRFRRCTPLVQLLFLTAAVDLAGSVMHQNRQERFLFTTLLPLWLAAAGVTAGWFTGGPYRRAVGAAAALALLVHCAGSVPALLDSERVRARAFALYSAAGELQAALEWVRGRVPRDARVVVHGRSNALSPAMFGWELGPPAGFVHFPACVRGKARDEAIAADRVLLIVSTSPATDPEIDAGDEEHRRIVEQRVARGEFEPEGAFPLAGAGVEFRLYRATAVASR